MLQHDNYNFLFDQNKLFHSYEELDQASFTIYKMITSSTYLYKFGVRSFIYMLEDAKK